MFKDRVLLIATKHQKEIVLGPVFKENLQVKIFVPHNFNSDMFGTFSGEIERKEDSVTTAKIKCLHALKKYGFDLGIASEGSFGSHPSLPFIPANEEFLVFIDLKNDLEIVERNLSLETNFSTKQISDWKDLVDFAESIHFPSHALILRTKKDYKTHSFIKEINDWVHLKSSYEQLQNEKLDLFAETDMRAMYNPTRMQVIAETGEKLIRKIKSCCPQCKSPGFGITSITTGLPCKFCNAPTNSVLNHHYQCQKCSFLAKDNFPLGKRYEDPLYCSQCNP